MACGSSCNPGHKGGLEHLVLGQNRLDSFEGGHKCCLRSCSIRYESRVWLRIGEGLDYAAYTARKAMSRIG